MINATVEQVHPILRRGVALAGVQLVTAAGALNIAVWEEDAHLFAGAAPATLRKKGLQVVQLRPETAGEL